MNALVHESWLSPITIPAPADRLLDHDIDRPQNGGGFPTASLNITSMTDEGHIAFYRWMVGHHISICTWRLLDEELATLDAWPAEENQKSLGVAFLMDTYTAALVYAGSCSPETYASVIRPIMIASNPSMSGTWARDYESLSERIKGHAPLPSTEFAKAYRRNHQVHMHLGRHLVPQGKSLLQETGRVHDVVSDAEYTAFDQFFRVNRRSTTWAQFKFQYLRCILQTLADLKARPLVSESFPAACQGAALTCFETFSKLAHKLGE